MGALPPDTPPNGDTPATVALHADTQRFLSRHQLSEAFQDEVIGKRLPDWIRKVPVDQWPVLSQALASSLNCRQRLNTLLARIEGIDRFVASALERALAERHGLRCNAHRMRFIAGRREPVINTQPVGVHLTEVVYEEKPLLEVVLRNFTADQTQAGGQPAGNRLLVPCRVSGRLPTAIEFAALCRELDLGERYQRHLDSILEPADDSQSVKTLLVDACRHAMLVDAHKARQDGRLDDSELRLLTAMCREGVLLRLAGDLVEPRRLTLLGCTLEQVVVLEVIDQGVLFNTTRRLLMYIPGDPVAPWTAFDSLNALNRELGHRLRVKSYQGFFSRFVLRRDSQAFFGRAVPVFDDLPVWASFDLKPQLRPYPAPLFIRLAQSRIRQIKEDAATIAMPVARLDRDAQRAHDQRLAAEGWLLLNVAGLFVPGIGLGLLALTVWEVMGEVYHGLEALHEKDAQEALEHLSNVAIDLATIAAAVVGVTAVQRVWSRSAVVDAMLPARLEDGSVKLWQQDLAPYRSGVPSAAASRDALGILRLDGAAWVEMDGHHYPVVEADPGQWQLRPRDGNGPSLRHNGAGAWRVWSEQPAQWDDTRRMFRRLGEPLNQMSDEQIDEVLNIHGLEAEHLRALHVYGRAPEPGMLDTAERCRLAQRIRQLVNRLRAGQQVEDVTVLQHARRLPGASEASDQALAELVWTQRRTLLGHLYDAVQASDSTASATLRRMFPSLHPRAAQALLAAASGEDRRRLLETGRVSLSLSEAARRSAASTRAVRVFEAFFLDTPQNADLARVVLALLKYLPGAAEGLRWRLFEGSMNGPLLLATEQGVEPFALVHAYGTFQLIDGQGLAQGNAGELFEVMAAAYSSQQRQAMQIGDPFAHNLRVMLAREAIRRRAEVVSVLSPLRPGAFRPPQRWAQGRLGYPLGGSNSSGTRTRRANRSLAAMLRDLYPSFSDEQVAAWAANVQRSRRPVEDVLSALRQQYTVLQNVLRAWVAQAEGETQQDRGNVRDTLINGWRRMVTDAESHIDTEDNYRIVIYNNRVGDLPELPAQVSFPHVSDLSLLRLQLEEVPQSFLLAFPRLRSLDLGGNLLTRLPQPLLQMPHLRQLSLTDNQIVLTISQAATLASASTLEYIDLSFNPLGRTFTLNGLASLRWLSLRSTGLTHFPHAFNSRANLLFMDMRENRIRQIPEEFFRLPIDIRRRIRLAGNPLSEAESLRLQASLFAPFLPVDEALLQEQYARARGVWGDAIGPRYRGVMIAAWEAVDVGEPANRFFRVLQQLLQSADFQINAQALAQRILALLQAMATEPALREELLAVANDEWGCQDGATWCLSNLELNVLVWRARTDVRGNTEQALLALGVRLWRLDEVDRIALQDILQRGGNPDESEVGLAYRVGLRTRLNLPIEVGDMSFGQIAGVTDEQLERAAARVEENQTQEEIARSMVDRTFWQTYLERAHPERFLQLDRPFRRRLDAVLDDDTLTDETRRLHADAILGEQRAARRGLMLDLTLNALQVGPDDPAIEAR
ncbi:MULTISPECIES: NEL-type E3 ubiquitin ligase domain-containing protein [unclassified Pseudomonas]|uniref:NEL-type E3 ubiquitin ligase domain-containing protein n=1 Tax=unclassified Pseudomonas TaxID=196821 RepID=UPI0009DEF186|nr:MULTISPECIES: NEL-type E3 ubiquitin ligase domain-containing protein [unclassified Pseudomonas]RAS33942.1 leucine rich repeat (LRR) protein [Pseudomonas sp. URMO17WK12:I7]SME89700.1 Leucine rich repeat-containing protein [Pseudomonas sp. URMO17WK12:I5]